MRKLPPKCIKIIKTLNLYLCFFTMGLCGAVPGPCLLDLQRIVDTTAQHIGFIYTAKSVGYVLGSILGGILLDFVKSKQVIMTLFNFIVSSTMLGIPWCCDLATLTSLMVVNGFALGAVDIGGNVICLSLWGNDSGPFYQALHFTFGLGGLVAPLIAAPFLGDHIEDIYSSTDSNSTVFNTTTYSTSAAYNNFSTISTNSSNKLFNGSGTVDSPSNIIYPFSIIGSFGLFVTLMSLAICIASPTEEKRSQTKNSMDAKLTFGFLFTLLSLNFLLLFAETGIEIGYAQMLTTYVVKGRLKLPSSVGSYMTSAFWAAFTVSRLASVFLAIKVSNFALIINDLVITLVGSFVLLFLASYEWAMWLASVLLGIGIASFSPAAVGWLDSYIHVTSKIASLFTVGAAVGVMVIPFTISYFTDTLPDVLIYAVLASSLSSSLIVFILYMLLRESDKRCVNL